MNQTPDMTPGSSPGLAHGPIHEPFETFRARLKPQIRPEQTLVRLRRALRVDDAFRAEYEALRPFLKPLLHSWPEAVLAQLSCFPEPSAQLDAEAEALLGRLLKAHALQLTIGRFDQGYLDTLEDVALFLVWRDVKSIWLAGVYQQITCEAIALVMERADARRAPRQRQLISILVRALALELNQIQRVFTLCASLSAPPTAEGDPATPAPAHPAPLPLEPDTLERVGETLDALAPQAELIAAAFLKRLFEEEPPLRCYFGDDLAAAEAEVAAALRAGGAATRRPDALAAALETLGTARALLLSERPRRKAMRLTLAHTLKRAAGLGWGETQEEAFTAALRAASQRLGAVAEKALNNERAQARAERQDAAIQN